MQLSKILRCHDCGDSWPRWSKMVGLTGFEPVTPRLSSVCSNQLSYRPFRAQKAPKLVSKLSVKKWRQGDSNSWHPACKAGALPTELCPLNSHPTLSFIFRERQRLNCALQRERRAITFGSDDFSFTCPSFTSCESWDIDLSALLNWTHVRVRPSGITP